MRPLPTASSLERALACRASERLPHIRRESSRAARGTALHAYLEALSGGATQDAALAMVPEQWRADAAALPVETMPLGSAYATEVTLAWDYVTGEARILGKGLGRDYSGARPTEYVGTVDVLARLEDRVWVADYKSSRNGKTAAARNAQLGFLGLAAARAHGVEAADVVLVFLDGTQPDGASLDAFDLDRWEGQLRDLAAYYESDAQDAPQMGEWCRYCPALAACPAQQQTLALVAAGEVLPATLTPEVVARAWHRLQAIRGAVEAAGEVIDAYARQTPVDLGDGRELREVTTARESVDGAAAWRVLVGFAGQDVAEAACTLSASKSSVTKAIKASAPKGKGAAMEREVLGLLRQAGAITTSESTSVKAVKAATAIEGGES